MGSLEPALRLDATQHRDNSRVVCGSARFLGVVGIIQPHCGAHRCYLRLVAATAHSWQREQDHGISTCRQQPRQQRCRAQNKSLNCRRLPCKMSHFLTDWFTMLGLLSTGCFKTTCLRWPPMSRVSSAAVREQSQSRSKARALKSSCAAQHLWMAHIAASAADTTDHTEACTAQEPRFLDPEHLSADG
jgi:hypothetical protein